jgi:hypothetical protein
VSVTRNGKLGDDTVGAKNFTFLKATTAEITTALTRTKQFLVGQGLAETDIHNQPEVMSG